MDHSPPHFFVFPIPAPGHTLPFLDLAKLFATRGARATVILVENDTSSSAVASISRLQQLGHLISVELLNLPTEIGDLDSLQKAKNMAEAHKLVEAFPRLEPAFRGLVADLRPDCVVTDTFLPWTADVAEEFGIPRLLFPGTSNFAMCASHAVRKYTPQATATSDSEPFVLPGLPDEISLTKGQIPNFQSTQMQEMWQRVEASKAKTYGLIMNSYYELEGNYIKHNMELMVGTKTWQVGPLFLINQDVKEAVMRGKTSEDAQEYINWLDSQQPNTVLYVCFGSFSTFPPAQMAEIAAALIEELSVPFIWVVKSIEVLPEGFEERVGERGLVIRGWAPQLVLLGHDAVGGFVTHCGWNSVLEGLTSGLPMVTWPVFAEQFYNEKLVTEVLRVGVKVGAEKWGMPDMEKEVVPRERVKEAVGRVMGDGEEADGIRERARTAAEAARAAVAEGGSSYLELDRLIGEVKAMRVKSNTKSDLDLL